MDGVIGQIQIDYYTFNPIYPLWNFVYSNNTISRLGMKKLFLCEGNLADLKLNNIKFEGEDARDRLKIMEDFI